MKTSSNTLLILWGEYYGCLTGQLMLQSDHYVSNMKQRVYRGAVPLMTLAWVTYTGRSFSFMNWLCSLTPPTFHTQTNQITVGSDLNNITLEGALLSLLARQWCGQERGAGVSSACASLNCCVSHACSVHTGSVSAAALLPLAALSFYRVPCLFLLRTARVTRRK